MGAIEGSKNKTNRVLFEKEHETSNFQKKSLTVTVKCHRAKHTGRYKEIHLTARKLRLKLSL